MARRLRPETVAHPH